jgi:nucleotide-binding universal stress UspA family protein
MALKDILAFIELPLEPPSEPAALTPALAQAIELAREPAARLRVVVSTPRIFAPSSMLFTGFTEELAARANEAAEAAAANLAAAARTALGAAGLHGEVTSGCDPIELALGDVARLGRAADLIVVDRAAAPLDSRGSVFSAALFETGRPVLLPASNAARAARVRKVLLAWDGSRSATRAAQAALGLFAPAAEIVLATVEGEKSLAGRLSAEDMAAHLARHGARVTTVALPMFDGVAVTLERHAEAIGADVIAMGGFATPRWRELLFGGVTREVMLAARFPVMLAN